MYTRRRIHHGILFADTHQIYFCCIQHWVCQYSSGSFKLRLTSAIGAKCTTKSTSAVLLNRKSLGYLCQGSIPFNYFMSWQQSLYQMFANKTCATCYNYFHAVSNKLSNTVDVFVDSKSQPSSLIKLRLFGSIIVCSIPS